jgi:hypothetical protein
MSSKPPLYLSSLSIILTPLSVKMEIMDLYDKTLLQKVRTRDPMFKVVDNAINTAKL